MKNILNNFFEIAIGIDELIKTSSTGKIENSENSSGEIQAKLDVLSDILVENKLKELNEVKKIVSEEKEGILDVNKNGKYLIAYDPLDGSSLIDVNLSVGTIFGIYENDFNGKDLVASCYIVYGPRLEVVFADNNGVRFYRFIGNKFVEVKLKKLKEKGNILSPGGKNSQWLESQRNLINSFWEDGYRLRYSGGMVPDLHQIILKGGGIFSYPELKNKPDGKLRKLFEVFPFAFIFEKLGGGAIDNKGNKLLDLGYNNLHEPSVCYFGSQSEIERVKKLI